MQSVITMKDAKRITGGRTPLVPVQYETAIKALTECVTLDDAKIWSDKADALAAWAKIYKSGDAERKARALKLHAYRRMAQLAKELRPTKTGPNGDGPAKLLQREHGFTKQEAACVLAVGNTPEPTFKRAVQAESPPTPNFFRRTAGAPNGVQRSYTRYAVRVISDFYRYAKQNDPVICAESCASEYSNPSVIRDQVEFIAGWLDDFERSIPKRCGDGL